MNYKSVILLFLLASPSYGVALDDSDTKTAQQQCVRGCEGWGFFAEFLWVLNHLHYCKNTNKIPVVHWDKKFAYFHPEGYSGCTNCWEYYFEPVSTAVHKVGCYNPRTLGNYLDDSRAMQVQKKHIYEPNFSTIWDYFQYPLRLSLCDEQEKKDFILVTHGQFVTGENYPHAGRHLYNKEFRSYVKREIIDPYIKIKEPIARAIDAFYAKNMAGKRTIGIHLRGKHGGNEVPYVPVELLLAEANKHASDNVQFFIATDQSALIDLAKRTLNGPVLYYESERFAQSTAPSPGPKKLHPLLGENLIIEMVLLSLCDHLVHTISNVSTTALYFNPALEHTLLY